LSQAVILRFFDETLEWLGLFKAWELRRSEQLPALNGQGERTLQGRKVAVDGSVGQALFAAP
jgi:hypothetical protein